MKAIEVLINSINGQLQEINKSNFKIYDADNRDWFLESVEYCSEDDRLIFNTKEDKEWSCMN